MAYLRIVVLIWADLLASYVMFIMQNYLTDVWNLGFTHAAGIMNVANGLTQVLPLLFYFFVNAGLGNKLMLFFSSLSYAIGLGLLSMSTPPVLAKATGTCNDYNPECIGHTQKALFYTALALIAVGISGHIVSLVALFVNQFEKKPDEPVETMVSKPDLPSELELNQKIVEAVQKRRGLPVKVPSILRRTPPKPRPRPPINQNENKTDDSPEVDLLGLQFQPVDAILALVTKEQKKVLWACLLVIIPVIALFVLPYIKPWSLRFGLPAIFTLVGLLFFLHGFRECKDERSEESPVTNVFKVILAATLKMCKRHPKDSELYGNSEDELQGLHHTDRLRWLDKAAIEEGPDKRRWILCKVRDVEQTKIVIHMIPICFSLVLCGLVTSLGNTYFIEQANHMNYKLGKWKLPDSLLLILYGAGKISAKSMYKSISDRFGKKIAPRVGIAFAILSATLCCIVAALVEKRRIHVIIGHGLVDKPDDDIPLTVFILVPQYLLLAGLDSLYENSVTPFLSDQSPPAMKKYLVFLNPGLSGLGIIGSVLSVYVVGRISERNGNPNWFQDDLNASRLDRYYWTIAALSAANFVWFIVCAILYPYRDIPSNDEEETANQVDTEAGEGGQELFNQFVTDAIKENIHTKSPSH